MRPKNGIRLAVLVADSAETIFFHRNFMLRWHKLFNGVAECLITVP